MCRACGAAAPADAHFCPSCGKILPLPRQADYYAFFGLPRHLTLDPADLERKFRSLSRQFHPDFFYNATVAERRASLERSSYLNDAYRALKPPASRVANLLELEGVLTAADRSESGQTKQAPPELLEEVFALNEELDEVRALKSAGVSEQQWQPRLRAAAVPIERKRDEHERDLEALAVRWDGLADRPTADPERVAVLAALRARVLERNYITNLLATIDREAGAGMTAPAGAPRH